MQRTVWAGHFASCQHSNRSISFKPGKVRFWVTQAYAGAPPPPPAQAATFLTKPPADTPVLLGFVKDDAHLSWIKVTRHYNLRADGRTGSVGLRAAELGAELVVLYGPPLPMAEVWRVVDGPQVIARRRMIELGYPSPRGELYICLPIEPVTGEWAARLPRESVERLREWEAPAVPYGAPVVTTRLAVVGIAPENLER